MAQPPALRFVERENCAVLRFPVAYGFSGMALQFLIECGICGLSLLYTLTVYISYCQCWGLGGYYIFQVTSNVMYYFSHILTDNDER